MADPVRRNFPSAAQALANKYGPASFLPERGIDTPIQSLASQPSVDALLKADVERVLRGAQPISRTDSLGVLETLESGKPATPEPEPGGVSGFVGDVLGNASDLLRGLPRLPKALFDEAVEIPNTVPNALEAIGEADSPTQAIGNLAATPVIRAIPGSYVAENLFRGQDVTNPDSVEGSPGQLLENPLYTALDVTPFVSKAAKSTRVGQAALTNHLTTGAPYRPISTNLTRTLDESGNLTPNRVGTAINKANERFAPTTVSQAYRKLFGNDARLTMGHQALAGHQVTRAMETDAGLPEGWLSSQLELAPDTPKFDATANQVLSEIREARDMFDKLVGDSDNPVYVQDLFHRMTHDPNSLTSPELAYATVHSNIVNNMRVWGQETGRLAESFANNQTFGEWYEAPVAKRLNRDWEDIRFYEQIENQRAVLSMDPADVPLDDILDRLVTASRTRNFATGEEVIRPYKGNRSARLAVEGDLIALGNVGFDTSNLLKSLRTATSKKKIALWTERELDAFLTNPRSLWNGSSPLGAAENYIKLFPSPANRRNAQVRFHDAVRNRNARQARAALRELKPPEPLKSELLRELTLMGDQQKFLDATASYRPKLTNARRRLKQRTDKNPPARFAPKLEQQFLDELKREIDVHFAGTPDFDRYLDLYAAREYDRIEFPIDPDTGQPFTTVSDIKREIKGGWTDLKDAGFNPYFVHRAGENALSAMARPNILEVPRTPSDTLARGFDATPHVPDPQLALTHQAYEYVNRRGSEAFIDQVAKLGTTKAQLRDRYRERAKSIIARDPTRDLTTVMDQLISKEWTPFNPGEFVSFPTGALKRWDSQDIWVRHEIKSNLAELHKAPSDRIITSLFDPVMKVFRTSLLPLSIRWQINNFGSMMVLFSATASSPNATRNLLNAYKMARGQADDVPAELLLSQGAFNVPAEFADHWNDRIRRAGQGDVVATRELAQGGRAYLGGKTLRRLWDEATLKTGKFISGSYSLNQFFDDMLRSFSYLDYNDKINRSLARKAGLDTAEVAAEAAIGHANRVMMNWGKMTAWERTIMRSVFPFYGWIQHILKFTLAYPGNHPVRASIYSNLIEAEMSDWETSEGGSSLPRDIGHLLFLGAPDADGNVTALGMGGANPFGDVANWFSLAGFLATNGDQGDLRALGGNFNPILGAALEAFGVDPVTSGPDLFPQMTFNPETGRLEPKGRGFGEALVGNILPQSRAFTVFTDEWGDIVERDPDAARRMIAGSLGVPTVTQNVNVPDEQIRGELNRQQAADEAKREAMRTGNFDAMNEYPSLRPLAAMMKSLDEQGLLERFRPPVREDSRSLGSLFAGAITQQTQR